MNRARAARWVSRFIGLAMVVVALLVLRVMERQLQRLGESVERSREPSREAPLPQPPSASLPSVPRPGEPPPDEVHELDSKRVAPEADPSKAAREEALPEPGHVPEGAVW